METRLPAPAKDELGVLGQRLVLPAETHLPAPCGREAHFRVETAESLHNSKPEDTRVGEVAQLRPRTAQRADLRESLI